MRVLYFTVADSPHDRRFLSALAGSSHEVFVLRHSACTPQTPAGITELSWPKGCPDWSHWGGWQEGCSQLLEILDQVKPDLVHAGPIHKPAYLTALAGFHPLVSMSWGSDLLMHAKRSPWMGYATRCALSQTDILLADCQTVADEAVRYGFPSDRIVQFPWGVDLNHFSPQNAQAAGRELRSTLGWDDKFVLLCNRTWSPIYGVDLLAQAFTRAVQNNPNLRLLLVGDGPQSLKIKRILEPVADFVHLPGWMDQADLPAAYGAVDLFITPSHCDGSSVSLLEALACGCPVLASDIPSNQEWILPGQTGDLFIDADLESLEEKISTMSEDPHLVLYGKAARHLAERRADWRVNFKKLLTAYAMAVV